MPGVPPHEHALARPPRDGVGRVGDADLLGVPHRSQIGSGGEGELEALLSIARVGELVSDDDAGLSVGAELEPLDLDAFEHRVISEPRAVGVGDELPGLRQGDLPPARRVPHGHPEPVHQLDRMDPEPTHLAGDMVTHVGEAAILASDQVRPVAGGDVGPLLALDVRRDAVHGGRGVLALADEWAGDGQADESQVERNSHDGKGGCPGLDMPSGAARMSSRAKRGILLVQARSLAALGMTFGFRVKDTSSPRT